MHQSNLNQQHSQARLTQANRLHFPNKQMEFTSQLPLDELSQDHLLTTEELATWLGVKAGTLVKARSTGLGNYPAYEKISRKVRYRVGDVRAWLQARKCDHGGYLV